jgi:hypothetical protein
METAQRTGAKVKSILDRKFTELLVALVGSGVTTRDRARRVAHGLLSQNRCGCRARP